MWKRVGVIALWVLATVGTASITMAAVNQVGERVTQQAAVPIDSEDLLASPAVQALALTTTVPPTTVDSVATTTSAATSSTLADSTTTTAASSSTTSPPASTSTTSSQGVTVSRSLVGGTVRITYSGNSVTYVSAVPAAGGLWTVEVKNHGPEEVVVEFESEDHESHFKASVENGELVIDIEESDED